MQSTPGCCNLPLEIGKLKSISQTLACQTTFFISHQKCLCQYEAFPHKHPTDHAFCVLPNLFFFLQSSQSTKSESTKSVISSHELGLGPAAMVPVDVPVCFEALLAAICNIPAASTKLEFDIWLLGVLQALNRSTFNEMNMDDVQTRIVD